MKALDFQSLQRLAHASLFLFYAKLLFKKLTVWDFSFNITV